MLARLSQLKAITFDVGGTLIRPWPSVGEVYAQTAARHGFHNLSPDLLRRRFIAAWTARPEFNHTRADWAELVDETFEGLTEPAPSQTFFPELYDHFANPGAWRLFDDVLPTLNALVPVGLKLGIISNWDERLRPLLQALNLHHFFHTTIVSAEIGAAKPAPLIFETAATQLGVAPETILHVGDSLPRDILGARSAGFQALLLQRGAGATAPDQINSLQEILS